MSRETSRLHHQFSALSSAEHSQRAPHVVLVPIGAVEQHGRHLPVGTDAWISAYISDRVAADTERVLVAEPLAYGSSGHHQHFSGTLSLRPSTVVALAVDIASSISAYGDIPVFLNGHGGNRPPLGVALQEMVMTQVDAWSLSYFDELESTLDELFSPSHDVAGHACAMETSIVAHLWPDSVRHDAEIEAGGQEAWPAPFLFSRAVAQTNRSFREISESGVVGRPELHSADAGRILVDTAVEKVGQVVETILNNSSLR